MKIMIVTEDAEITKALFAMPPDNNEYSFSGQNDAMEMIRTTAPDVVLLAAEPELKAALTLLQKIRTHQELSETCIMVLLSGISVKEQQLAIQSGADEILEWPFDLQLLSFRATRILKLRRLENKEETSNVGKITQQLRHDLNNPLAGIIATVQLLQIQFQNPVWEEKLRTIEELAFRIHEMMSQLGKNQIPERPACEKGSASAMVN